MILKKSDFDTSLGLSKYESFNSLSKKEKNIVVHQLITDSINYIRDKEAGNINEGFDPINPSYEGFENLPMNIQESRIKKYINESIGR